MDYRKDSRALLPDAAQLVVICAADCIDWSAIESGDGNRDGFGQNFQTGYIDTQPSVDRRVIEDW